MKFTFIILISIFNFPFSGNSQAILSSHQEIDGMHIYSDFKDTNKFYYAPGNLELFLDQDGKPDFKLIEMRYTGTGVTGNQGEKRFMNIVQFRIIMKQHKSSFISEVKEALSPKAELRPLPLNQVDASLVAPFEGTYKKIGNGAFDSTGKSGNSSKNKYWTERVFTVRLENHEAQLLWNMVEKGQLAMSLTYAYYADIINDKIIDFNSDSDSLTSEITETIKEIKSRDSIASPTMIHTDAFSFNIDFEKYPDVLVKKDLNVGIPPAYPALQVVCYDFYNDLRNDLAMKTIEFQATGLSDNIVKLRPMKFLSVNRDLHTLQVRFPFAVNMQKPLRYKIKEYTQDGELIDKGWVTNDSWIGILDITSQEKDLKVGRRNIEIEADITSMKELGIDKYDVVLEYQYLDGWYQSTVSFTNIDDLPLKQISILSNVDQAIEYKIIKTKDQRRFSTMKRIVAIDDYVYLNMVN